MPSKTLSVFKHLAGVFLPCRNRLAILWFLPTSWSDHKTSNIYPDVGQNQSQEKQTTPNIASWDSVDSEDLQARGKLPRNWTQIWEKKIFSLFNNYCKTWISVFDSRRTTQSAESSIFRMRFESASPFLVTSMKRIIMNKRYAGVTAVWVPCERKSKKLAILDFFLSFPHEIYAILPRTRCRTASAM